ncbi:MAG: PAS domain-containing protein, partial [Desulfobacteraceae bacterium]
MKGDKRYWFSIPPWIIMGAVIILVPIFVFWTFENINKQKENTALLLSEKGAALIRSFEAGARTGMMGMHTSDFQLQQLLTETALQPDIVYLIITDTQGTILAHNDPAKIGWTHGRDLDLERISRSDEVQWHQVSDPDGAHIFEVFRQFSPTHRHFQRQRHRMMHTPPTFSPREQRSESGQIIFLGLDMGPIEVARKEDARHTILMASILLLIGFAGIVSLFLAQAYRTAHTSLTRVKAFSDTVVENIPIGLLAIDADRKVIAFNQAAESVLHLSSGEVLGKRADEVLPGKFLSLIDELNTKEGIISREIDCTLENGKRIPLDASVSFLEGEEDAFLGNVVLFRDLTEVQNLKREVETAR